MMELPNERPATYQDILDLPETRVGEIINGQLAAPCERSTGSDAVIPPRPHITRPSIVSEQK